jgi:hypothetical protein
MRRAHISGNGDHTLDDWIEQNQSFEETRVKEGQICELAAAHAVADAYQGTGHLVTEGVDHVKEITAVIEPCRCYD